MDRTRELLGRPRWRDWPRFGLDLSPRLRVERQFFFPNRAKSRRQIGRLLRNLASDTNQWKPPLMYVCPDGCRRRFGVAVHHAFQFPSFTNPLCSDFQDYHVTGNWRTNIPKQACYVSKHPARRPRNAYPLQEAALLNNVW